MRASLSAFALASGLLATVSAWSIGVERDRHACQLPHHGKSPLDGCDARRTLYVNPAGNTSYTTIQSAVNALPNNTNPYTILIASGNYTEQVNVTRQGPTYLLGQTSSPTDYTANTVNIIWAAVAGTGDNTYTTTLTIAPNLNASLTGSGTTGFAVPDDTPYGCVDFRTYNLNVINEFVPYSDGPSLALGISRANGSFYHTRFLSYQDTIYVGKLGNAYLASGEVAGQTDFFYGFGTCYTTHTNITLRSCGGGITAWKGTNTTFANKYGVYITNSTINAANASIAAQELGKCALGRPWNAQMRSIFSYTYMNADILPTGFIDWSPARYTNGSANDTSLNWGFGNLATIQAEYMNSGPGWNLSARQSSKFERLLTPAQYAEFSGPQEVFQFPNGSFGNYRWIDFGVGT